jgi:hypothetical protein
MIVRPLTAFTIAELVVLHDASIAAAAAWMSLLNQPRCETDALVGLIEDEMERADAIGTQVIDALLKRHPTGSTEAIVWADALLRHAGGYVGWDRASAIIAEASIIKDIAPSKGGAK